MISQDQLDEARLDVAQRAKQGIDFITAACIIWCAVAILWLQDYSTYNKSVFTLMVGGALMPLAWMFSKVYKTDWSKGGNPLQPFGLWLNVAQLFYFPILVLILVYAPEYFIETFIIITGAHFFPFAWFYKQKAYAIVAGVIVMGALALSLLLDDNLQNLLPIFMCISLMILAIWIIVSNRILS